METHRAFTLYDYFGFELPYAERYRLIRAAGFSGIGVWWGGDRRRSDYRDYPRLARREGLFVECAHTPFEDINNLWLDNQDGADLTEGLLRCVTDCSEYEIPTMIMHLSSGQEPPPYNTLGLDRVKRIVEAAEKHGVNVALENLRKNAYLNYVFSQIDSPRLCFCFDSGHQHCRTPGDDVLAKFGNKLTALHLHDNDGSSSGAHEDDQHRLPFDGTIDWNATMRKVAATGYTGPVSLEVINRDYGNLTAEEFLRRAFERAEKLYAMLISP